VCRPRTFAERFEVKLTLDGVTFRGRVPLLTHEELPELGDLIDKFGELTDLRDLERFEGKTARRIRALALRGPETFNFCRRFSELGVQELADLLDVDRRTISRWEHGDVEIPKPVMAIIALLADEHSRGKSHLKTQLSRPQYKRPKNINVDAG
jgi:transcriptional regulator with XRE-family HTH domain